MNFMQKVRVKDARGNTGYVVDKQVAKCEGDVDFYKVAFIEPGTPLVKGLADVGKSLWIADINLEVLDG